MIRNNKFDFYNITEIADKKYRILDRALKRIIVKRDFSIYQLADFLIIDLERDSEKYKSKLVVVRGDLSFQTHKLQEKTMYLFVKSFTNDEM